MAESKLVARLGRLYAQVATSFFCRLKTIQLSPFIKDIFLTTLTSVVVTLSVVIVTRLLAQGLGPEKFGAYSLARRMLSTIAPFSLLGMDVTITRYVALAQDRRGQDWYLLNGLLLGVVPGLLILIIGLIFRTPLTLLVFRDTAYTSLFIATLILVVGYSCYIVLYAFYRGSGRMSRANLWQIGVIGLGPVFIAFSLADSGRVDVIIFLLAVLLFCSLIPLGIYTFRAIRHQTVLMLLPLTREMLEYGLPRVPAGLALAGILAIGPFLASYVGSLEDAGYLAAGQSVLLIVEGGIVAFGLVALPKVTQLAAAGQHDFLRNSISDVIAFILHLGLFATLHILLWADQAVFLLLGEQYGGAIPLMRIILLALIPYLAYVLLRSIVNAVEKKAINTLNLFISFVFSLITALLLVGLGFEVKGLALGTTIGFLVLGFLTIRYLWQRYQLKGNSLQLRGALFLNIGLIIVAFLLKRWLVEVFSGLMLIGVVIGIEGSLFLLLILALRKAQVRWLLELEKRVIRKENET